MADLLTLGTGSSGNCYVLTDDSGNKLLLDAGIKRSEIVKGLSFSLSGLKGCVVTHSHHDHDLCAEELKLMGIDVWQPYLDENKRQIHKFDSFSTQSFPVNHDDTDCVGYYIKFSGKKMLYLTDLSYCPYSFANQDINILLCECNYAQKYLDMEQGSYNHKVKGHMSLENLKQFIVHNQSVSLTTIIICHMGKATLDVDESIQEIKQIAMPFTDVYAAKKGRTIQL